MADDKLEEAVLAAGRIAKKLPAGLQEAAFHRALDHLLGQSDPTPTRTQVRRSGGKQSRGEDTNPAQVDDLLAAIDRTAHPDISATSRTADQALKVLQLAHETYGVDGLTASQVTEILSQKFRIPVKVATVKMALQRETSTVDVCKGPDGSNVFRIMAPGDEYLARLRSDAVSGSPTPSAGPKKRRAPKKKPTSPKEERPAQTPAEGQKSARGKKNGTRPGPKAAVSLLVNAGFFSEARTLSQIQEELKHHKGHTYSVQELSPALVRSLRDNTLTRERNGVGQYEYTRA